MKTLQLGLPCLLTIVLVVLGLGDSQFGLLLLQPPCGPTSGGGSLPGEGETPGGSPKVQLTWSHQEFLVEVVVEVRMDVLCWVVVNEMHSSLPMRLLDSDVEFWNSCDYWFWKH